MNIVGEEKRLNPVEDYKLTLKMEIVKKRGTKSPILSLSLSRHSL